MLAGADGERDEQKQTWGMEGKNKNDKTEQSNKIMKQSQQMPSFFQLPNLACLRTALL